MLALVVAIDKVTTAFSGLESTLGAMSLTLVLRVAGTEISAGNFLQMIMQMMLKMRSITFLLVFFMNSGLNILSSTNTFLNLMYCSLVILASS